MEHRYTDPGATDERDVVIEDPAVMRALFGPLRHRLMGLLGTPKAAKELADELGVPTGRLYYHLDVLTKAGLVEVADQRVVGTNVERLFRRAGDRFIIADELARSPFAMASAVSQLDESVRRALADLRAPVTSTDDDCGKDGDGVSERREVRQVVDIELQLDADRAEDLVRRINDVLAEFRAQPKRRKRNAPTATGDERTYGVLIVVAPRAAKDTP